MAYDIRKDCGRPYRVCGADRVSGTDVEITIEARDEDDALRTANRQGVLVSECTPLGPDQIASGDDTGGPTAARLAQTLADDPVVQKLLVKFPGLSRRIGRLDEEDRSFLANLVRTLHGVSYRDSAHVAGLVSRDCNLPGN